VIDETANFIYHDFDEKSCHCQKMNLFILTDEGKTNEIQI